MTNAQTLPLPRKENTIRPCATTATTATAPAIATLVIAALVIAALVIGTLVGFACSPSRPMKKVQSEIRLR